jgi:outer membrane immunogenic protein
MSMKMKKYLLGGLAMLAVTASAPASAADMATKAPILQPAVAVYDPWAGFYVGANAGYSFGPWSSNNPAPNTLAAAGFGGFGPGLTSTASPKVDGWLGGGQLGYNWQRNNFVFGLEADFDWTGEKATNAGAATLLNVPFGDGRLLLNGASSNEWKLKWLSTVRARAGVLVAPQWLIFGTGGLAVGATRFSNTTTLSAVAISGGGVVTTLATATTASTESKTKAGWTIGAGIENMFAKNWSAKFEYLYVDLGSYTFLTGTGSETNVKLRDHIVRAGVNYHF